MMMIGVSGARWEKKGERRTMMKMAMMRPKWTRLLPRDGRERESRIALGRTTHGGRDGRTGR